MAAIRTCETCLWKVGAGHRCRGSERSKPRTGAPSQPASAKAFLTKFGS